MDTIKELESIALECDRLAQASKREPLSNIIDGLEKAIAKAAESSSNSWIGYQSRVYYRDFQRPAKGDHFTSEWGLQEAYSNPASDKWQEVDFEEVNEFVMRTAGYPDIRSLEAAAKQCAELFESHRDEIVSILAVALDQVKSPDVEELRDEARALKIFSKEDFVNVLAPSQSMTRDSIAASQGRMPPHHIRIVAWLTEQQHPFIQLEALSKIALRAAKLLTRQQNMNLVSSLPSNQCVFIGHGRDAQWKDVVGFIRDRLHITVEEFNRQPTAGMTIKERLEEMLDKSTFALLIMTSEDEHADGSLHARENVIHEIGLFQGRLGFRRAIILLEEGCREFSNITGILQIRFPRGYIKGAFEEVREVLEREGILTVN